MDYGEALNYIHGTFKFGIKFGLDNIGNLLRLMGDPHKKLRFVHVAGTNGKGSTAAFISSILKAAGYRTGLYTSPYIQRFTERIRVDGDEIAEDDVARLAGYVREKADAYTASGGNHPTEFEIVTAIAFQHYMEMQCDVVVLEVGMGGRFDATNIIDTPELAVITTISYDHTERLGNTLAKIAFEKAGIIKRGGDVLLYPQAPEAGAVFEEVCAQRGARLRKADFGRLAIRSFGLDGQVFDFHGRTGIGISLLGSHQANNAAMAICASEILREKSFDISEENLREGLAGAKWPGRLELLRKKPVFVIDGAHNRECAEALKTALDKYFPGKKIDFIFGVLRDKDYESMVEILAPVARRFIAVEPDSERALPVRELSGLLARYCHNVMIGDTIERAVDLGLDVQDDGIICACGSLSFIGHVRGLLESTDFSRIP